MCSRKFPMVNRKIITLRPLHINKFFKEIDTLIDWLPIEKELKKVVRSGKKERGQKAYNPLILFKMQLISIWYNLSDVQTQETVSVR